MSMNKHSRLRFRSPFLTSLLLTLTVGVLAVAQSSVTYHPETGGGVTWPISDATFAVDDNGDGNELKFDLSLLSADRTYIWPNAAGTVALTDLVQTFSATQTIASDTANLRFGTGQHFITYRTGQTVDTALFALGTTSRNLLFIEDGDEVFDYGHAQQTNPTLFGHSANQSTTQWWSLTHNATNAVAGVGTGGWLFSLGGTAGPLLTNGVVQLGSINGAIAWQDNNDVSAGTIDLQMRRIAAGELALYDAATTYYGFRAARMSIATFPTVTVDGATTFAVTSSYHTLACTGAETINTITGGTLGMELTLLSNDTECTIADDDTATAANAVNLTGTATNDVGAAGKHLFLRHDGNAWQQVSESANN